MEQAFDTFQNQLVFARDCELGNFFRERYVRERYVCPCCENDVFLAGGVIQSPHFKHHQGAPDCERRAAGMAHGLFSDIERESRDVNVVISFSRRREVSSCDFSLRYRPSYEVDAVRVIMGSHDKGYQLHGRGEIDIPISESSEHIVLIGFVSGEAVVRRIVKAFGKTPALFRHGSRSSVQLPEKRVIRPGRYVACFPGDVSIQFPLACKASDLRCDLGLRAVSFVVPPDFNQRIASFCRETFGTDVQIRNFSSGLVKPLALSEAAPDCWTTGMEGEAQIVLGSRIRENRPIQVVVQYREKAKLVREVQQVSFEGCPYTLKVEVGRHRPLVRIGMGNPVQFLTELRYVEAFPAPEGTRFQFAFRRAEGGEVIHSCRSSSELPRLLNEVRVGNHEVESIEYPATVRLSASDQLSRVGLAPDSQANDLTLLLRNSSERLWIEATGYRPIVVPRSSTAAHRPPLEGKLQPTARLLPSRRRQAQAFLLGSCSSYSAYIANK